MNENVYFNEIGLPNRKERDEKLALIKEFHDAVKSGVNARIQYAVISIKRDIYGYLWNKTVDLITAAAHSVYWTPVALELMAVHDPFFGTISLKDWVLFPYYFQIRHNFTKEIPDKFISFGPPIELLKNPPFPGKMYAIAATFIQYTSSLFHGKITLTRHGKSY
jgi:hypothetical protein